MQLWRVVTVVTALMMLVSLVLSVPPCPARCRSCVNGVVDCHRRSLVAPPRAYPPGTKELNLQGNYLRVLGARSFPATPTLEKLNMQSNRITSLRHDAFRTTPALVTLDLSNNRIRRVYRRALRGVQHLRTLTLNHNHIRSLRGIFNFNPGLYQLNLAKNRIVSIGEQDLRHLTGLHYLDLRDNNINQIHPNAFKSLRRLRYLFLNSNPLVRWTGMQWSSPNLQLVDLSHCRLEAVPGPLPHSVGDLRLGHNQLTQIQHTDFLNITDLQMLALNDNQLQFVADGTFTHLSLLQEVYLRGNMLQYIPRDLPANLRRLHMDINRISTIETGQFPADARLEYLTLENNQLTSVTPGVLQGLRFLNSVNLQSNLIRVIQTRAFDSLGTLATLQLSGNPLERIERDAFKQLENLTTLTISHLGVENCSLEYNPFPQMLRLQNLNLMASPGIAQAVMDIVNNPQNRDILRDMTHLDLAYDDLEWVSPRLRTMFPSLTHLILDGNALRCTRNMSWLGQWMQTDRSMTFYNYADITCENPARLNGRLLKQLRDNEWAAPDEPDGFSSLRSHGLGELQGDSPTGVLTSVNSDLTPALYPGMDSLNSEYAASVLKGKKRTRISSQGKGRKKKGRSNKGKNKRKNSKKNRRGSKKSKNKKKGNNKEERLRKRENKKRRNKKEKSKKTRITSI